MKNKILIAGLSISIALLSACKNDDDDSNNSMNNTDRNFMTMASYGNYNEIDAGGVAVSHGNTTMVTSFGSMMQMDHGVAQSDLSAMGARKNVSLPTGPDSAHIAMKQMLMTLSGRSFDTAYMNAQVRDHQATIDLFQDEIANGRDGEVKNFASTKLPVIQHHHHMADSIARAL